MSMEPILYRPPSEARHPLIRLTYGCSHNRCRFCSMYYDVPFQVRSLENIEADMQRWSDHLPNAEILFFADGNAFCLSTDKLLQAMHLAKVFFPKVKSFRCYASVMDIARKSDEDLAALQAAGLDLVYIGLETGDEEIAKALDIGFMPTDYVIQGRRLKKVGIRQSVTLICGLSEKNMVTLRKVAEKAASLISQVEPEFVAYLTLYLEPNAPLYEDWQRGIIQLPTPAEALQEIYYFLVAVDAPNTRFSANHASNYCAVNGILGKERKQMLLRLKNAIQEEVYRPDWLRGL